MSTILTLELFQPQVGQIFNAVFSDAILPLTLTVAQPLKSASNPNPGREPFELRFTCPQLVRQNIYALDNPALGRAEIFLVPIGETEGGYHYQAVFN